MKLGGGHKVSDLLQAFQKQALESEPHHYHPLPEIQALSELGQELLDHIIVFENYPVASQIEANKSQEGVSERPFEIRNGRYAVQTNYDLSIKVYFFDQLEVQFDYNANQYQSETIARNSFPN